MKRLLTLLDIILFAASVHAQETIKEYRPVVEEGKQWHYKVCNIDSAPEYYEEWYQDYELEGDTIIGTNKCLKLYAMSDNQARSYRHHYRGALFENDCKVYFIPAGRIVPEILYNFSCPQGSLVTINGIDILIAQQKVVSYKSSSWTITYWKPKECEAYQDSWLEGIGSLTDLIDYVEMWLPGSYHSELLSCTVNDRLIWDMSEFKNSLQELDSYRPFIEEGKLWVARSDMPMMWRWGLSPTGTKDDRYYNYFVAYFYFEGDTIIANHRCKHWIHRYENIATGESRTFSVPVCEENKKVWFFLDHEETPFLLYDFGAEIGDTVVCLPANLPIYRLLCRDYGSRANESYLQNGYDSLVIYDKGTKMVGGRLQKIQYFYNLRIPEQDRFTNYILQDSYQMEGIGTPCEPNYEYAIMPRQTAISFLGYCAVGNEVLYEDQEGASYYGIPLPTSIRPVPSLENRKCFDKCFDLSGRRLSARPARGLYIEDGQLKVAK